MSEWISVKERLPQGADGKSFCEDVIAVTVVGEVVTGWLNGDTWFLVMPKDTRHTEWGMDFITHWMPLPNPPVVVAENATASEEG